MSNQTENKEPQPLLAKKMNEKKNSTTSKPTKKKDIFLKNCFYYCFIFIFVCFFLEILIPTYISEFKTIHSKQKGIFNKTRYNNVFKVNSENWKKYCEKNVQHMDKPQNMCFTCFTRSIFDIILCFINKFHIRETKNKKKNNRKKAKGAYCEHTN